MSDTAINLSSSAPTTVPAPPGVKSFVQHAKLIGFLTFISRLVGAGREIVAGHYIGTGLVGSAFTVAFVVPNLFRKLFGEGALSAAFIPLYAQTIKRGEGTDANLANDFAAAAVNLLVVILVALTLIGEAIIFALMHFDRDFRPDRVLMFQLTAIMLPYVVLICGGAFLSGILQVHKRFGPPAAAPIILNACHILVLLIGARMIGLSRSTPADLVVAKQTTLAYALAGVVLIAGVLQVAVLLPALRQVGFRFKIVARFWTPLIKRMLWLSLPVAIGAGVLQISVLIDTGLSMALMQGVDRAGHAVTHFSCFGHLVRFPLEIGAPRRLALAQFLYQFPLGIFAIALATAIFPALSTEALEKDRGKFRAALRQGIEASMWEGLPASLGLILVAEPTARLMFQHGQIGPHDAALIARSAMFYAGAIWAFSLLQIINRAYYAVHDTVTPLVMSIMNITINLAVEIPLLWVPGLTESGMAVGTLVSFTVQALVMLWMLDRKIGGLNLRQSLVPILKMILAALIMAAACLAVKHSAIYPHGNTRMIWAAQLLILLIVGAGVYLGLCAAMRISVMQDLLPHRKRRTPLR